MHTRCITTGKGEKGAVFVCETSRGDIVIKALKTAPGKYDVYSEVPNKKYKTVILAPNITELRKRVAEWLDYEIKREERKSDRGFQPQPRPVGV